MRRQRRLVVSTIITGLTLVLVGCGSGGTDDDTGGSGNAVDTPSDAYKLAEQRLTDFSSQELALPVTEPVTLPAEPLSIVYTQCVQTVCTQIGDAVAEAATAIGATYTPLFHQDTPETVQAAFQQAVQMEADIVLTSGDPVEWFQEQLDQLNEQGAAVVGWSVEGGFTPEGFAANLIGTDDYYFLGVLMADYAVTHADGPANVLFLNLPAYPVLATLGEGVITEVSAACPDCTVTTVDFTVDDVVAGNVTSGAVAALQRNPDTNYIIGAFGGLITQQLTQGLSSAGFGDIPAISASGTTSNYELIQAGESQVADLSLPTGLLAWRAVDVGLRALAGQEIEVYQRPASADIEGHPDVLNGGITHMFLDVDTAPAAGSSFDPVPDYQQEFLTLWGVS